MIKCLLKTILRSGYKCLLTYLRSNNNLVPHPILQETASVVMLPSDKLGFRLKCFKEKSSLNCNKNNTSSGRYTQDKHCGA